LENEELVDRIEDPVRLFYRYSLPGSMIGKRLGK
jgi:F420-non-reducing hydrogenase small subunit